jgi:SAM-dependent methyltransferase
MPDAASPRSLWRRPLDTYQGLAMRCAPGTHEAAMKLLRESNAYPGAVLDLASGSGALLARLIDAGFGDVTAVELDRGKFGLPGVVPLGIDLNTDFAAKIERRFGLVTAIEIIEHLDSPRHFLLQARELLTDDGVLLLSTPNVAEWVGRIKFLLTGTLRNFDDLQYRHNHHVSPLPDVQLRNMAAEIGLRVIGFTTAGTFFGPLKMACLAPIWWPFRLLFGPKVLGDVNLYLLARSTPRPSRAGDWSNTSVT